MSLFHASAEQRELVESFVRPLEELFPVARLHREGQSDFDQWEAAAEFGWFGVSLPEDQGGIGLTCVEEALLFAQFGRHLLSPCFMAAALGAKLAAHSGNHALARHILSGDMKLAIARRDARGGLLLIDAGQAGLCVVLADDGAALVPAEALEGRTALDDEQWSTALESARCAGNPLAKLGRDEIGAEVGLLIAAQLTGIAGATLDMAVSYAQIRQQFGAPIGSFQAIKHFCADMAMQLQAAKDSLSFAAVAVAQDREDSRFQAASALVVAIRAALFNTGRNIQIHGGMGFSAECDAHLFLKRAHVLETLAGGLRGARAGLRGQDSAFGANAA